MTKKYDTQEQLEAFDAYVKRNPAGRQVHHTGTLGYDNNEWCAFEEGWNAALAQTSTQCEKQPAQGPVACVQDLDEVKRKHLIYQKGMDWKDPLYTAPQQQEPRNFCPRCGKRRGGDVNYIHTCTPPRGLEMT